MAKREVEQRSDIGWLNPLNKMAIQKAVRSKATFVNLGSSGTFYIIYLTRPNGTQVIQLKHFEKFTPVGFFEKKVLLDKQWLVE